MCGDSYTETNPVDASYEGVQTDGDCSANPLGITANGDSHDWQHAALAHLVEHHTCNMGVQGSNP